MSLVVIPDGFVENLFQLPLGQSRALDELDSPDFAGDPERVLGIHGLHSLLSETIEGCLVFSQIELSTDEYDRDVRRMVVDLWVPLYHSSAC